MRRLNGFDDVVEDLFCDGILDNIPVGDHCHEGNGDVRGGLFHLLEEFQAVHLGHAVIEKYQVKGFLFQYFYGVGRVIYGLYLNSFLFEK